MFSHVAAEQESIDRPIAHSHRAAMSRTTQEFPGSSGWVDYVLGPENELAYHAVRSLSIGNAEGLSPLILHGPSGAGKSRLLAELATQFLVHNPEASITSMSAEALLVFRDFEQLQSVEWSDLRTRFRESQLIVLDDLHALRNCPGIWDELKHVLDGLDDRGAILAVAARTAPNHWNTWPRRLTDRFSSGLSVEVGLPSERSIARYLVVRCNQLGIEAPTEPADTTTRSRLTYRHLDGNLARATLEKSTTVSISETSSEDEGIEPIVVLEGICKKVAEHFGISLARLKSRSRRRELVEPRHLAMYLARTTARLSLSAIGSYFSSRDRTSVRHACESSIARITADPCFAAVAHMLQSNIEAIPTLRSMH